MFPNNWWFVFISLVFFKVITAISINEPSSVICPQDSELKNGVCECNNSQCPIPSCKLPSGGVVNITSNATKTPGMCCPQHVCVECTHHDIIAGNCSCGPETHINIAGKCICNDPSKSLKNGTCQCDENKCLMPHLCDDKSVSVQVQQDCCVVTSCVQCPADSYPFRYEDAQIEDVCVCNACHEPPKCGANEERLIEVIGTNQPSRCCDVYKCVSITNRNCTDNGEIYKNNVSWYHGEKGKCVCKNGINHCSYISNESNSNVNLTCTDDGLIHAHLSNWAPDECTKCRCNNGTKRCIAASACGATEIEYKPKPNITLECPSIANCKKSCDLGFQHKDGCTICNCKSYDGEFKLLLRNWINEHNLTDEQLKHIVLLYLSEHNKYLNGPTTEQNIGMADGTVSVCNPEKWCTVSASIIIAGIFLVLLAVTLSVVLIYYCCNKKSIKLHSYKAVEKGKETKQIFLSRADGQV